MNKQDTYESYHGTLDRLAQDILNGLHTYVPFAWLGDVIKYINQIGNYDNNPVLVYMSHSEPGFILFLDKKG